MSSDVGSVEEHTCQQADSSAFVARVAVAKGASRDYAFLRLSGAPSKWSMGLILILKAGFKICIRKSYSKMVLDPQWCDWARMGCFCPGMYLVLTVILGRL